MSDISNLLFTQNHEWVRPRKGKTIVVGISDYGQNLLSDATNVELPEPDEQVCSAGDEIGVLESLRTSIPIHVPVSGRITRVNPELLSNPELINQDPYGEGWLFEMIMEDPDELDGLMGQDEYEAILPEEEEE
jgi:glycine cleavage system H protein